MTAEKQGQGAAALVRRLLRLRERWLLIATLLTALFWLRDGIETHLALPEAVERQEAAIAALSDRVGTVETRLTWAERWILRCAGPSDTALPRHQPIALDRAPAEGAEAVAAGLCDPRP